MSTYHVKLDGFTPDERAKFRALGGAAWVRLQLRKEAMPTAARKVDMLTADERAFVVTSGLPPMTVAARIGIDCEAVRNLRRRAKRDARAA